MEEMSEMPKIEKEVTTSLVTFGIPELDNILQGGNSQKQSDPSVRKSWDR